MRPTLVLDNGAYAIKACWDRASGDDDAVRIVPNAAVRGKADRRVLLADEISSLTNVSGIAYRLPFEKGYLNNWEVQVPIWDRLFSQQLMAVDPSTSNLLLTEPCFNLPNIQSAYDQVVFEEYDFAGHARLTAPQVASFGSIGSTHVPDGEMAAEPGCCLVVDCGYSFTHIVPIINHQPVTGAIRRLNVGGKLLTNVLKETISFRHYNMMDETFLVNIIKERSCYVASSPQAFRSDLKVCQQYPLNTKRNSVLQEYVLPNGETSVYGYVRGQHGPQQADADEQVLLMNHERFAIPELLFHPSDLGMEQAGIAEAIVQSLKSVKEELHELLLANIILIGGTARLPGFRDRLYAELRPLILSHYAIRVSAAKDPMTAAAECGRQMTLDGKLTPYLVSRKEYDEHGSNVWLRRGLLAEYTKHTVSAAPPEPTAAAVASPAMTHASTPEVQQPAVQATMRRPRQVKTAAKPAPVVVDSSSTESSASEGESSKRRKSLSRGRGGRKSRGRGPASRPSVPRRPRAPVASASMEQAPAGAAAATATTGYKKPEFPACGNCRYSHVSCSHTRPCVRCIRTGREASCADYYQGYRPPGF